MKQEPYGPFRHRAATLGWCVLTLSSCGQQGLSRFNAPCTGPACDSAMVPALQEPTDTGSGATVLPGTSTGAATGTGSVVTTTDSGTPTTDTGGTPTEDCGDLRDNDGDGDVDCDDTDCDGSCPERCADGRDNDGDGDVDCADAECAAACPEDCIDGVDNDADGDVDCDDQDCASTCDSDGDGYRSEGVGGDDCDDLDPYTHPGQPEVCGGGDEDCDGKVDDADDSVDPATTGLWYHDGDGDGFGDPGDPVRACTRPPDAVDNARDCDDTRQAVNPDAPEITCDTLDNDCSAATPDEVDADGDGDGSCTDCDDHNPDRSTIRGEICDGIDNDCNSVVPAREVDNDGDGDSPCEGDPDDTNPRDRVLYAIGDSVDQWTATRRYRGNVYEATEANILRDFAAWVQPTADCELHYYVHQSSALGGVYTQVWRGVAVHDATYGPKSSPPIDLATVPGRFYALGVGFVCEVTYYRDDRSSLDADGGIGIYRGSMLENAYTAYDQNFVPTGIAASPNGYHQDVYAHR